MRASGTRPPSDFVRLPSFSVVSDLPLGRVRDHVRRTPLWGKGTPANKRYRDLQIACFHKVIQN